MSWNGFYPPHNCRNCGLPLSGENGPRPAELYAGTYTGLCYKCQSIAKAVVHTSHLDGAMHISYRAQNYSGLGSRVCYVAYADCPVCNGNGRIKGEYNRNACCYSYRHCMTCHHRYYEEPHRKVYSEASSKLSRLLRIASNNAFVQNIATRFGEYLKIEPKTKKCKGKGRSKMVYRPRNQMWTYSFKQDMDIPPEIKQAVDNTLIVYYRTWEDKDAALNARLQSKHPLAANDMKRITHPLYN